MKRLVLVVCFVCLSINCFAKQELDFVLNVVKKDIVFSLQKGTIVCVLGFDSPSKEMSAYIQDELTSLVTSSGKVKVVTRAHMDKVEKELKYQLSGYVSDDTALSMCQRLGAKSIVFGQ